MIGTPNENTEICPVVKSDVWTLKKAEAGKLGLFAIVKFVNSAKIWRPNSIKF